MKRSRCFLPPYHLEHVLEAGLETRSGPHSVRRQLTLAATFPSSLVRGVILARPHRLPDFLRAPDQDLQVGNLVHGAVTPLSAPAHKRPLGDSESNV